MEKVLDEVNDMLLNQHKFSSIRMEEVKVVSCVAYQIISIYYNLNILYLKKTTLRYFINIKKTNKALRSNSRGLTSTSPCSKLFFRDIIYLYFLIALFNSLSISGGKTPS